MTISIITATFNSDITLRDTINSVFKQSYKDIELIIKDGGSKDGTLSICHEYQNRFGEHIRILSCPDKGLYDAMNQGINAATGDIVGILNSDDYFYDEHVLEQVVKAFEDPQIGCVYGDLNFVDAKNTKKLVREWKGSQYEERGFRKGWHPAHPTFYARRELFQKYGAFDTSFDVSADFELMLRFIEKYHVKSQYIPKKFVNMRMGGKSTGSIKNIIIGNRNVLRAFKKNGFSIPPFYTIRRLASKAINMLKVKLSRND